MPIQCSNKSWVAVCQHWGKNTAQTQGNGGVKKVHFNELKEQKV
jgi:hypothetical protein